MIIHSNSRRRKMFGDNTFSTLYLSYFLSWLMTLGLVNRFRLNPNAKGDDFWDLNPDLILMPKFRETFSLFPNPSRVMWAIYMVYDYYSQYFNNPLQIRISLAEKEVLEDEGFFEREKEKLQPIIDFYNELQKDSPRRYLETFRITFEDRRRYMASQKYDEKSYKILESLILTTKGILQQEEEILKMLNKEESGRIKGGISPGMLVSGKLNTPERVTKRKKKDEGIQDS